MICIILAISAFVILRSINKDKPSGSVSSTNANNYQVIRKYIAEEFKKIGVEPNGAYSSAIAIQTNNRKKFVSYKYKGITYRIDLDNNNNPIGFKIVSRNNN